MKYGGNTACVEVALGNDRVLVLDAGSGIRGLGSSLIERCAGRSLSVHLMLSHFHWDHIQGIPFFQPLHRREDTVSIYSSHPTSTLENVLRQQMSWPYYPISFSSMASEKLYCELDREAVQIEDAVIHPFPVYHPQGATGFRIECNGGVAVYATDAEHGHEQLDKVMREYAEGADVLLYDAQYTPEEYESRRGYGHSTWLAAANLARDARVKELILFHHDPTRDDESIDELVWKASRVFPNTSAAAEGRVIRIDT